MLPNTPEFKVFDENAISLLGRFLNPAAQPMAKMVEAMSRFWRMIGRVSGIALSRGNFQLYFHEKMIGR